MAAPPRIYVTQPNQSSLIPRQALKWFENKSFTWKGILSDELLAGIKRVLNGAITTGQGLSDTLTALDQVFAPYVGNKSALPDQEQKTPYRLETLVRTVTTEAYNQGRKDMFESDPFVVGFRFSAILDSRTCFYKETPVRLSSGREVPVESIRPGNIIISGAGKARKVVQVVKHPCKDWREVKLKNGAVVRCTPTHPFWTYALGQDFSWKEAQFLGPGSFCTGIIHGAPENLSDSFEDLLRVREELHKARLPLHSSDFLLFSSLLLQASASKKNLRELWGAFYDFSVSFQEELYLRSVLLQELLQVCSQKRVSACPTYSKMSGLRQGIPFWSERSSSRCRANSLLSCVSDAPSYKAVPDLQEAFYFLGDGETDLLLQNLLSSVQNGDSDRSNGSSRTRSNENSLRSRNAFWGKMVSGFWSSSDQNRHRSERDLLAQGCSRSQKVQEVRRTQESWLDCSSNYGGLPHRLSSAHPSTEPDCSVVPKAQTLLEVESVTTFREENWAYDVQVENDHSYLVSGGIIVHNTPVCKFLHGKVLPAGSSVLDRLSPPRHHQCRSLLVPVTANTGPPNFINEIDVNRAIQLSGRDFTDHSQDVRVYGDLQIQGGPAWEVLAELLA